MRAQAAVPGSKEQMVTKKDIKRVQVLMSSYNGEKYIAQQIESILRQKHVHVDLLVRDDGSRDSTWNILNKYSAEYQNVHAYAGENIGTQKSFFHLLTHADLQMDYYAFSDQDDVWHSQKLYRAVQILESKAGHQPLLYSGNVICASENLKLRKHNYCPVRRQPSFGNALVENICRGCTEVFNKNLFELVRTHPPRCAILHDWWLYMSASCFGEVYFDDKAYILYRQHGGNQVGMPDTLWKRWKHRLLNIESLRGMLSVQAEDFTYVYKDMPIKSRELILMNGYRQDRKKKQAILMGDTVYRQSLIDQLLYKILFGINYL